ncbi:MAG: hypothetical protein QNJ46_22825 [Leptolyngbyaceae cyanobacterium MO_188.B28]|nr:hypothetical protein [Leptolyngbyaceae cyanobacterium MO_188.B28]
MHISIAHPRAKPPKIGDDSAQRLGRQSNRGGAVARGVAIEGGDILGPISFINEIFGVTA